MFYPLAFLMGVGVEPKQIRILAELMGIKTFVNEFVAYERMSKYERDGDLAVCTQRLLTKYKRSGSYQTPSHIRAMWIQQFRCNRHSIGLDRCE